MNNDSINELTGNIENRLGSKISELEKVTAELRADVNASSGAEQQKNVDLLKATESFLNELKHAHNNIRELIRQRQQD